MRILGSAAEAGGGSGGLPSVRFVMSVLRLWVGFGGYFCNGIVAWCAVVNLGEFFGG